MYLCCAPCIVIHCIACDACSAVMKLILEPHVHVYAYRITLPDADMVLEDDCPPSLSAMTGRPLTGSDMARKEREGQLDCKEEEDGDDYAKSVLRVWPLLHIQYTYTHTVHIHTYSTHTVHVYSLLHCMYSVYTILYNKLNFWPIICTFSG